MKSNAFLAASLLTVMATACGSSPEPAPVVEQIIVREPGAPDVNRPVGQAATDAADGVGEGALNLATLGEDAFQACTGCHNADLGGPNMAGPNLHGVVGRKAGTLEDYPYSNALAGSDITWDIASLDRFLANPTSYAPGTSMVAGAVRDAETRAAIVAYLAATNE